MGMKAFVKSGLGMFGYILVSLAASAADEAVPATEVVPIEIEDIIYGDPNAPVEVIEYASFTCPHCAHFSVEMMPYLKENFISTGKVKLVFRNFIRDRLDMAVATTVRCTDNKELTKELVEAYFAEQSDWATAENQAAAITSIAYLHGISLAKVNECMADGAMMQGLVKKMKEGHDTYDISSVPAIIINGTKVAFKDYDDLKEKITLATGGN
ncbi:thioredoxin domain-containing protein [Kordiimonas pumila]